MDRNTSPRFVGRPIFKQVQNLIDPTTIQLFSNILKGVGRNPKNDGRKEGGLKVPMLIDAVQPVGSFIKITVAKVHDMNFLTDLDSAPFSMLVFNWAYNHCVQFALWTLRQVYLVTRLKSNVLYAVGRDPVCGAIGMELNRQDPKRDHDRTEQERR